MTSGQHEEHQNQQGPAPEIQENASPPVIQGFMTPWDSRLPSLHAPLTQDACASATAVKEQALLKRRLVKPLSIHFEIGYPVTGDHHRLGHPRNPQEISCKLC